MQAQQQAWLQDRALQGLVGGRALEHLGEAEPKIRFLNHIEQARHRPGGIELRLESGQVGWIGLCVQGCQRDPAPALLGAESDGRILLQSGIQGTQGLVHLGLQVGDEPLGVQRQLQRLIIPFAVALEVGRQVLVRIAVAVGPDHPDLLAAQALAQGLKHGDLIGDAIDAILTGSVLLHHRLAPQTPHDAIKRNVLLGWKDPDLALRKALEQVKRFHHRTVTVVVGAEVERGQQPGHHTSVVPTVGVADHRAQGEMVGRPGGLPFFHQVLQRLFAHHRKDDVPHDAIRLGQRRLGEGKQQVLLACDALEVLEQLALDLALGTCSDRVDGLDQQINEVVGQRAYAQMHERGESGQPGGIRVPAQLIGGFHGDAATAALQVARRRVIKQIRGKRDPSQKI